MVEVIRFTKEDVPTRCPVLKVLYRHVHIEIAVLPLAVYIMFETPLTYMKPLRIFRNTSVLLDSPPRISTFPKISENPLKFWDLGGTVRADSLNGHVALKL